VGFMKRAKDSMAQAQDAMQQASGMQQAAGAAGMGMPGAGEMQAQAAMAAKLNKIAQVGIEAPGTIKGAMAVGSPDISGGVPYNIDVTVELPGTPPYDVTIQQQLMPGPAQGITPGMSCVVKYDPDDPTSAILQTWG
jgi:hypothetical protein